MIMRGCFQNQAFINRLLRRVPEHNCGFVTKFGVPVGFALFDMNQKITRVWSFASDSSPNIEYQTLQYADETIVKAGPVEWLLMAAGPVNTLVWWIWARRIKTARPPTATNLNTINPNQRKESTMPTTTHSKSPSSDTASSPFETMNMQMAIYHIPPQSDCRCCRSSLRHKDCIRDKVTFKHFLASRVECIPCGPGCHKEGTSSAPINAPITPQVPEPLC
jgi:hypothetical protein